MNPEPPVSVWPDPAALGPLTDLYQLTMMAGYHALGKDQERATFEMFVRKLPANRSYLIAAGLEQAIGDLLRLAFTPEQVAAIRSRPPLSGCNPDFFDWLFALRFEGDVWALPEGTIVFPGEPMLRVEAPLAQAQWVETFLLASIGYPTLVASKAARIVQAAAGRPVFEYGTRRAPGPQAGLIAARSSYLAGCAGTSNVEAAIRFGIPCSGTMAHSWIQSFDSEPEALAAYAHIFPTSATLLVDTYDTLSAVALSAAIEPPIQAIRLDSGDLGTLSHEARALLDARGRSAVRIFASGDLDEWSIAELVASGAPIDGFGVGTEMVTSRDAPALALVYKLVAVDGAGRIKLSRGKKSYPLAKQVDRRRDAAGQFSADVVIRWDEVPLGEPLLREVVRGGKLVAPLPGLDAIRQQCRSQLAALPPGLRTFDGGLAFPVTYSPALEAEAARLEGLVAGH